jgi:hypothetical protein
VVDLAPLTCAASSDDELRAARELFVQAEHDEEADHWQDALEKLDRVSKVRLTPGVRYHVAFCHEHLGHLTTALDGYRLAQEQAESAGARDVIQLASAEIAALVPRIPHVTIQLSPGVVGARVTVDGQRIDASRFGEAVSIDPGRHKLEGAATGYVDASTEISVSEGESTMATLSFVPIVVAPAVAPAPVLTAERSRSVYFPTGAVAATAAAVGLAGLGVGAYFAGAQALATGRATCAGQTSPCDSQKQTVRAWDWAAFGLWGGATVSTALAVFLWSNHNGRVSKDESPHVLVGPSSLAVAGTF